MGIANKKKFVRRHTDHVAFVREVRRKDEAIKSHAKAKMLRSYAKLCVKENVESDRVHIGPKTTTKDERRERAGSKIAKPFPFSKEVEIAAQRAAPANKNRENVQKEINAAECQRRVRHREHTEHTKKGQPKMKNKILSLLNKLQGKS